MKFLLFTLLLFSCSRGNVTSPSQVDRKTVDIILTPHFEQSKFDLDKDHLRELSEIDDNEHITGYWEDDCTNYNNETVDFYLTPDHLYEVQNIYFNYCNDLSYSIISKTKVSLTNRDLIKKYDSKTIENVKGPQTFISEIDRRETEVYFIVRSKKLIEKLKKSKDLLFGYLYWEVDVFYKIEDPSIFGDRIQSFPYSILNITDENEFAENKIDMEPYDLRIEYFKTKPDISKLSTISDLEIEPDYERYFSSADDNFSYNILLPCKSNSKTDVYIAKHDVCRSEIETKFIWKKEYSYSYPYSCEEIDIYTLGDYYRETVDDSSCEAHIPLEISWNDSYTPDYSWETDMCYKVDSKTKGNLYKVAQDRSFCEQFLDYSYEWVKGEYSARLKCHKIGSVEGKVFYKKLADVEFCGEKPSAP